MGSITHRRTGGGGDRPGKGIQMIKRGSKVRIDGVVYVVTAVENYGFFVKGRRYIVLHTDDYEIVAE